MYNYILLQYSLFIKYILIYYYHTAVHVFNIVFYLPSEIFLNSDVYFSYVTNADDLNTYVHKININYRIVLQNTEHFQTFTTLHYKNTNYLLIHQI